MEKLMQHKLKYGFTIAQWGVDLCFGALFIAIASIVSAFVKEEDNLINALMLPFVMCLVGLLMFAVGRTIVGLQSRKLNLYTDRALTLEEKWFVSSMLEVEEKGSGVNYLNRAAEMTGREIDNIAAGMAGMEVVGKFFKIGRRYTGHSLVMNRLPAIVSLAAAIVITLFAFFSNRDII